MTTYVLPIFLYIVGNQRKIHGYMRNNWYKVPIHNIVTLLRLLGPA